MSCADEWKEVWKTELTDKPVSEYSLVSPSEGFAEFGRLVFSEPKRAREDYPQAWAVWEQHGLVDKRVKRDA